MDITSHALSNEAIQETLKDVMEKVELFVPGKTQKEKKSWCAKRIRDFLEMFDNYIPIVGMFLDNPIVDDLETQAVNLLVDWAWDRFHDETTSKDK